MKHIKIPPPVAMTHVSNPLVKFDPPTLGLPDMLLARLADPVWAKSPKLIMQQSKLATAIRSANGILSLEDHDYEALAAVVDSPSEGYGYDSRCSHCLVPLFKSFEETTETNPEAH